MPAFVRHLPVLLSTCWLLSLGMLLCGQDLTVVGSQGTLTLSLPSRWMAGTTCTGAVASTGTPGALQLSLQPAVLRGEPDSPFCNFIGSPSDAPDPTWWSRRQSCFQEQATILTPQLSPTAISIGVPATVTADIYLLCATLDGTTASMAIEVMQPGGISLTLFHPQQRSVFRSDERIELDCILAASTPLSASTIAISIAPRAGASLQPATVWQPWTTLPVVGAGTSTLLVDAWGLQPGRYVVCAAYAGAQPPVTDVWPLQVVSGVPSSRFTVLSPAWAAGYTALLGPDSGQGQVSDIATLASEGITLADTEVYNQWQVPPLTPQPCGELDQAAAASALASANGSTLPRERFAIPSPVLIEAQEELRGDISAQRSLWGAWSLPWSWGDVTAIGRDRDDRNVQMLTQMQREVPSWIGNRLTSSLNWTGGAEAAALAAGYTGTIPSDADLDWARDASPRGFACDGPYPTETNVLAVLAAPDGSITFAEEQNGTLVTYSAAGVLTRSIPVSYSIRGLCEGPDGTIYCLAAYAQLSVVSPQGAVDTVTLPGIGNNPWGLALLGDGTLLVSDSDDGRICHVTPDGRVLGDVGDGAGLVDPQGLALAPDGSLYVSDAGLHGTVHLDASGNRVGFLAGVAGAQNFGAGSGLCLAPDGSIYAIGLYGTINHVASDGRLLGTISRMTLAAGGQSNISGVAISPVTGDLLVSDAGLPYVQEYTPAGDIVRILGLGTQLVDVRIDRSRYTWGGTIAVTLLAPLDAMPLPPATVVSAWVARGGAWQALPVTTISLTTATIAVPSLTGAATLRIVCAPAGSGSGDPRHADFAIQIATSTSTADAQRLAAIERAQEQWTQARVASHMGSAQRWSGLCAAIRPGCANLAPTNFGTGDTLRMATYLPALDAGMGAEAENEGTDVYAFPVMGPFYVARALEGPHPKPAWCTSVNGLWTSRDPTTPGAPIRGRPMRDVLMLLGAGAAGIGTGLRPQQMPPAMLTLHRQMVDVLHRVGDACLHLDLPGGGGVAILHSFSQEAMCVDDSEHFYTAHAAWYDLLRAHVPAAVVSEELVAAGQLIGRFRALLLPQIEHPLPPAVMDAIAAFQQAGGRVVVDLATRITVPHAEVLGCAYQPSWPALAHYSFYGGIGAGAYDGNAEYRLMRLASDARLPQVLATFGDLVPSGLTCADHEVFLQFRSGGQAQYVFVENDHFPTAPLRSTELVLDAPEPASVGVTVAAPVAYDALAMTGVSSGAQAVAFTDAAPARLYVLLPQPIAGVTVRAASSAHALAVRAAVTTADGAIIPAVLPLEVTIIDAQGLTQFHGWRATDATGVMTLSIPVGWLGAAGSWTVQVRDLLHGVTSSALVTITPPSTAPVLSGGSVLTFDRAATTAWLQRLVGKPVLIPLDAAQSGLQAMADDLASALQAQGILAQVVSIPHLTEVPVDLRYGATPAEMQTLATVMSGQAVGVRVASTDPSDYSFTTPGPAHLIHVPVILLGDPATNRYLQEIAAAGLLRRSLSPQYPGASRAVIEHVWAPFSAGCDAVVILATDRAGLQSGIQALLTSASTAATGDPDQPTAAPVPPDLGGPANATASDGAPGAGCGAGGLAGGIVAWGWLTWRRQRRAAARAKVDARPPSQSRPA